MDRSSWKVWPRDTRDSKRLSQPMSNECSLGLSRVFFSWRLPQFLRPSWMTGREMARTALVNNNTVNSWSLSAANFICAGNILKMSLIKKSFTFYYEMLQGNVFYYRNGMNHPIKIPLLECSMTSDSPSPKFHEYWIQWHFVNFVCYIAEWHQLNIVATIIIRFVWYKSTLFR